MDDELLDALPDDLREIADLLWEAAHGAPPLDEDPVWRWLSYAPAVSPEVALTYATENTL